MSAANHEHDYRSLILFAGDAYSLLPYDLSFTDTLYEAVSSSHSELARWVTWCEHGYSLEISRQWLEGRQRARLEQRSFDFAITDSATGELVGGCGISQLQPRHRFGRLYYWVRSGRTNRGAATAAAAAVAEFGLTRLGLVRLELLVPEKNRGAERVAEKVGSRREVLLRNRLIFRGEIHHAYLFSMLGSPEWVVAPPDPRWVKIA